jgi:hypothetical protein
MEMTFRDWYTQQFAEALSEPLSEDDGMAADDMYS